jgi:hypothetical protein
MVQFSGFRLQVPIFAAPNLYSQIRSLSLASNQGQPNVQWKKSNY